MIKIYRAAIQGPFYFFLIKVSSPVLSHFEQINHQQQSTGHDRVDVTYVYNKNDILRLHICVCLCLFG